MKHQICKTNVLALRKTGESFLFFYDAEDAEAMVRTLAKFAADPELNFSWSDAALLARDVSRFPPRQAAVPCPHCGVNFDPCFCAPPMPSNRSGSGKPR
jgi:hypothetical protein